MNPEHLLQIMTLLLQGCFDEVLAPRQPERDRTFRVLPRNIQSRRADIQPKYGNLENDWNRPLVQKRGRHIAWNFHANRVIYVERSATIDSRAISGDNAIYAIRFLPGVSFSFLFFFLSFWCASTFDRSVSLMKSCQCQYMEINCRTVRSVNTTFVSFLWNLPTERVEETVDEFSAQFLSLFARNWSRSTVAGWRVIGQEEGWNAKAIPAHL